LIRVVIKRREEPIPYATSSMFSIFTAIFISLLILMFFGVDPVLAFFGAFVKPMTNRFGWYGVINNGLILLLCGVGLVIAFKAGVWNIGAEGQILMGAIAATWVALYLMPNAEPNMIIASMFLLGFLAGGIWGVLAGILKAKMDVNEVLSTMMLNYIAYQLVYYLVMGPWENPRTRYPVSKPFPENARLPVLSKTLPLAIPTLIIAVIAPIVLYIFLYHTSIGYELRAVGSNPEAARSYGISQGKAIIIAMFISGGFAGLAGVHVVASGMPPQLRRPEQVSRGYGFIAILVAWLAGLNPLATYLSAIILGIFIIAGFQIQILFKTGIGVTNVFIGCLLITLSVAETLRYYDIIIRIEIPRVYKSVQKDVGGGV